MTVHRLLLIPALFLFSSTLIATPRVNITADIPYVDVVHAGKPVRIERKQEPDNYIEPDYAQTSRPCPPYCIQPMSLAPSVETIGELELLQLLRRMQQGEDILLLDSREEHWLKKGMIPGAIHLPWTLLHNETASDEDIAEVLQFRFGAVMTGQLWNFESAKMLILYCNGAWCGQSPTNIRALLSMGYPAHKLKWYRGGMQSWKLFGLTTVVLPNTE
ncbi:MAG: rhodanese-like domain-containing protein [Gammaproteobacteria bacterium]|nr:rhodanese-like domain-containing protein [Gammaproteobacteria bacterium]